MTRTPSSSHTPASDTLESPRQWHARVWQLTWPVILANITIPLVGVADVAVMGRLPDPAYIGAVAMGAAMFSAVYWLFGFLRMGTTGLTAQAWGAKQQQEIAAIFWRACTIAVVLGALIIVLQWPLRSMLFRLFDASDKVEGLAALYYNIRVYGAPGLLLHLVQLGTLFGLQRMRDTLWLSIGLNVSNLTLDIVLVLGFGMGVEGVAIGTTVSEWGAAVLGFWLIARAWRQMGIAGGVADLWHPAKLSALFNVSSNLILRTFFVQLPFFAGTVVATALGDITLAAHGVLMQLFFIMTYSLDGFAHTAETLAGYAYGARRPRQLRLAAVYCAQWGLGLAVLTGAAYYVLGNQFIALLTVSEELRQAAAAYLPWVALAPIFCVWAFLLDGVFIGTTYIREMRNAMIVSAAGWAVVLWLTYSDLGYHAVWLSMNLFMILRGVLLGLYYPRIEAGAALPAR